MPTTRKKVIKTVYKDEEDSEDAGDYSDSGSEAQVSEYSSSEDEDEPMVSSGDEFRNQSKPIIHKMPTKRPKKEKFSQVFITKIKKQISSGENDNMDGVAPALFSVKDLTDADKLLPSVLNLSESDSSDDERPKHGTTKMDTTNTSLQTIDSLNDSEVTTDDYKDVWSTNLNDTGEDIAKKAFMELEQHKAKVEETKVSIDSYNKKTEESMETDVKDLLALGEEVPQKSTAKLPLKRRKPQDDSDAEMEDWEEVKEQKPVQGLQLIVDFPNAACKKSKEVDVEMMMKRKINRVKKEYQVYMHKVHVLCWLGHGNYVSRVLNDQEVLSTALSLVPSKECYPGERVDMKYVEQITQWYKDKLQYKRDKNEDKFRPKAPPLKEILLSQIKKRSVSSKNYLVFIFVSMLRALGLKCRIMYNFVTLSIKPPSSELCSLSTKKTDEKIENSHKALSKNSNNKNKTVKKLKSVKKISQLDGNDDHLFIKSDEIYFDNIMQVDGNDDTLSRPTRNTRSNKPKNNTQKVDEDVSPSKKARQSPRPKKIESTDLSNPESKKNEYLSKSMKSKTPKCNLSSKKTLTNVTDEKAMKPFVSNDIVSSTEQSAENSKYESNHVRKLRSGKRKVDARKSDASDLKLSLGENISSTPNIIITNENNTSSVYFENKMMTSTVKKTSLSRNRSQTADPPVSQNSNISDSIEIVAKPKVRTKSAPRNSIEKSKYFNNKVGNDEDKMTKKINVAAKAKISEDKQRVSHRDLAKRRTTPKNDITEDLVDIIKTRVREAKVKTKQKLAKGKLKNESDEDSDHLPEETSKTHDSDSDDDFKPTKLSPKPSSSRKIDRRVISSEDETPNNKIDVWCEIFVEELEQWISVDVIRSKVHCSSEIYNKATHPVCYIVGWDNNNYLKDLTRRYVPHWNTVTRKQRAEPVWWNKSIQPWLGPKNAQDREEDENLDRMQLEAPLPKTINEYKNHPLYALKRHLLKFEAIYPPDAATLGFVRQEAVYARECVYICRSRDTWLKEAKVVKLGEKPYKVVKARPKWDKLSNKLITDKPLEVFGPWQVQDYEPPVAENGMVPRNAYGNVELFKACMLPKGTVHVKLPGLNRVARKLNIDCAPAMTGFDFNGGWSHPVYDGFVVCQEFEEIITQAWLEDQEEQERKEREKIDARVYGNWKKLIKGLLIRERLKDKYGFEKPTESKDNKKKNKGPRVVVKKGK